MVPSAALRGEWNVLLNPLHPAIGQIKIEEPQPFRFDARMFRQGRNQETGAKEQKDLRSVAVSFVSEARIVVLAQGKLWDAPQANETTILSALQICRASKSLA